MKDANFQTTYTIKIHGLTDGLDLAKIVSRELWDALHRLNELNPSLHYSLTEDRPYDESTSDLWPEVLQSS